MSIEFVVNKSERVFEIRDGNQLLYTFPAGVGKNPLGPKKRADDGRTPEGEYRVCVKNPRSKFYLSLGLNYPNIKDAEEGLKSGIISQQEYDAILKRHHTDGGSEWNTALGGAIYIHGDLESQSWSEGCIRLYNKDMETVFELATVGTRVTILP